MRIGDHSTGLSRSLASAALLFSERMGHGRGLTTLGVLFHRNIPRSETQCGPRCSAGPTFLCGLVLTSASIGTLSRSTSAFYSAVSRHSGSRRTAFDLTYPHCGVSMRRKAPFWFGPLNSPANVDVSSNSGGVSKPSNSPRFHFLRMTGIRSRQSLSRSSSRDDSLIGARVNFLYGPKTFAAPL